MLDLLLTDLEGKEYNLDDFDTLEDDLRLKISKVVHSLFDFLKENDFYTDFLIDIQLDTSETGNLDFEVIVLRSHDDSPNFHLLYDDLFDEVDGFGLFTDIEKISDDCLMLHINYSENL